MTVVFESSALCAREAEVPKAVVEADSERDAISFAAAIAPSSEYVMLPILVVLLLSAVLPLLLTVVLCVFVDASTLRFCEPAPVLARVRPLLPLTLLLVVLTLVAFEVVFCGLDLLCDIYLTTNRRRVVLGTAVARREDVFTLGLPAPPEITPPVVAPLFAAL